MVVAGLAAADPGSARAVRNAVPNAEEITLRSDSTLGLPGRAGDL